MYNKSKTMKRQDPMILLLVLIGSSLGTGMKEKKSNF